MAAKTKISRFRVVVFENYDLLVSYFLMPNNKKLEIETHSNPYICLYYIKHNLYYCYFYQKFTSGPFILSDISLYFLLFRDNKLEYLQIKKTRYEVR